MGYREDERVSVAAGISIANVGSNVPVTATSTALEN